MTSYFLWKNHGITLLAKSVNKIDDVMYEVEMEPSSHGVVDGGHTYRIIREAAAENDDAIDQQIVFGAGRIKEDCCCTTDRKNCQTCD